MSTLRPTRERPVDEPLLDPLLELIDVTRCYGHGEALVTALDSVSLRIMPGDFLSIMGPSGSGKSTMLGLLGCLDLPTSGTILVGGHEVSAMADDERSRVRGEQIGFVFQQFHLIPHLDAAAMWKPPCCTGISKRDRQERAIAALDRAGSAHRHDHRPVQ
jgi:putative ABC transport system ATP-binding protein